MNARRGILLAAAVSLAVALAGCSQVTPIPTPTPVKSPTGNQELRLLSMAVASGTTAAWAAAQEAGSALAVREINEAGGVLGKPVTLWQRVDATPATLTDAAKALGIDAAIVAPDPKALAGLMDAGTKAKVAVVGIGTTSNVATPTVKPLPDASLPPVISTGKPTGTSKPTTTSKAAPTQASAPSTAAARKPGTPVVPDAAFTARLKSSNPFLTDVTYGAESYQLAVALALAALVAQDDAGPSLVSGLEQITIGDVVCTDFASCRTVLLDNRAIKYVGPAGRMSFDARTGVVTFGS